MLKFPSAGATPFPMTICGPALNPQLSIMALTLPLRMRWMVRILRDTPVPQGIPGLRCHASTSYGNLPLSSTFSEHLMSLSFRITAIAEAIGVSSSTSTPTLPRSSASADPWKIHISNCSSLRTRDPSAAWRASLVVDGPSLSAAMIAGLS